MFFTILHTVLKKIWKKCDDKTIKDHIPRILIGGIAFYVLAICVLVSDLLVATVPQIAEKQKAAICVMFGIMLIDLYSVYTNFKQDNINVISIVKEMLIGKKD
mgnify:CR=1 FL=1